MRYFSEKSMDVLSVIDRCSNYAVRGRCRWDVGTIINSKFLVINL